MKEKFIKFIRDHGIESRYNDAYDAQSILRNEWHRWRGFDFWDDRNETRFLSGAFDWAIENAGREYPDRISWFDFSERWKDICRNKKATPVLNKNTKTI